MKVLHTESSLGWGGQENRTLNEMIGLRARGHSLSLACQPGARLGERAREAGFDVFETCMRNALDLAAIARLRRYMRQQRIEIVNCHSGRDTQIAGLAARTLCSRPRIVRTRHLALPITSRFTYSVLPDHVVTVSRCVADLLVSAGVARELITPVPTGIDFAQYDRARVPATLRDELGLPPDALLIGTVAILRVKKGHADILAAAPEVLRHFPQAHFVFAGDGPQSENLARQIAAMGLAGNVHLLGLRRDVINVLAGLDVFLLPTHQEALGTSFIEAGAMGLPVVATRVDGVPEVVQEGATGLLVSPGDSVALAGALRMLLADAALRARLGATAARFVRDRFSRESMALGMETVYARLLHGDPAR